MNAPIWILHFSADPLHGRNPQSRHHLMRALAARYRVVWINPYGFRMPAMLKRDIFLKVGRQLRRWREGVQATTEGWIVANPILLPLFTRSRWQKLNERLLQYQLARLCQRYSIRRAILFFSTPRYATAARLLQPWPSVFYFSDAYSRHRELSPAEREYMRWQEDELIRQSRTVICCSGPILRDVASRGFATPIVHFPHQVDYDRFRVARERLATPEDLRRIPRPIIGYYGTLTDSNDWETVRYAAARRPNYSFVFIGKKEIADTGMETLPNVHFLGFRPFEQIPDYGAAFDVAIMFWVRREWIRFCSPLKLKEYLALGRPVVSTLIEDVQEEFGDVVDCTETPEAFLAALDTRVAHPDPQRIGKGIERVREDSWNRILPYIEPLEALV